MVEANRPSHAVLDAPSGIRTRATALKGPRPGPLVDGGRGQLTPAAGKEIGGLETALAVTAGGSTVSASATALSKRDQTTWWGPIQAGHRKNDYLADALFSKASHPRSALAFTARSGNPRQAVAITKRATAVFTSFLNGSQRALPAARRIFVKLVSPTRVTVIGRRDPTLPIVILSVIATLLGVAAIYRSRTSQTLPGRRPP